MAAIDLLLNKFQTKPSPPGTEVTTWYCVASCALACSNAGSWVPNVYQIATEGLSAVERRKVLGRMFESLLKGAPLYGIPRLLNAFYPLAKAVGADDEMLALEDGAPVLSLRQSESYRNMLDHTERGMKYFRNIYREETDAILEPMYRLAPDIKQFSVNLEYGSYMSENAILSPIETSQVTLASLLPLDVPTQVKWHMRGLIRNGGTEEQVRYALEIAKDVVDAAEVSLKHDVPDMSVINDDNLFK
ncbi:hypothetical protein MBLNU459_g7717t1 [Dothideomycetes sp. NU459]